jgi:hypothetical protein
MYPSIWPTGCGPAASPRASPAAPSSLQRRQPSPWPVPPSRPPLCPIRRPRPNGLVLPSCSPFFSQRNAAFLQGKAHFAADFLFHLVALPKFMRLSLWKTAHVATGDRRITENPATLIHPKDEHKSVPWVQDTAWAGDLWCVSTSFHTDSPSALTGFPVKLGDVSEGYANVAGAAMQEIRAQSAFFCCRQYFRWVHTETTEETLEMHCGVRRQGEMQ